MNRPPNTRHLTTAKLQLGNGYFTDFDQLAQLLHHVCRDDRDRVSMLELAAAIGIADRNAKHLAGLAQAMGLLQAVTYKPTTWGRLVEAYDPFFDDLGTLWFIHYVISSDPRHLVWNRIVTDLVPSRRRVTRDQIRSAFDDLHQWYSAYSIQKHVLKEVNTVLDAYTQQRLSRLAYLRREPGVDGDAYVLAYREPVPALVLVASIVHFRDRARSGDSAVTIPDLLTAPNSPGVVFQLGEDRLRALLEDLKTQPGLSLESRADLDQLRLTDDATDVEWMRRYYASR